MNADQVQFGTYNLINRSYNNQVAPRRGFLDDLWLGIKKLPRRILQGVISTPVRLLSYLNPAGYKNGWQKVKRMHVQETQSNKSSHYLTEVINLGLDIFISMMSLGLWIPLMVTFPDAFVASKYIGTFLEGVQEPWTRKFFDKVCQWTKSDKWNYDDSHLFGSMGVYRD